MAASAKSSDDEHITVPDRPAALDQRTINDFGDQWTRYTDNSGYYGSAELLADIFGPLLSIDEIRGLRVADIGSGTGRIVNMLLDAGAAEVIAVEPSDAFDTLRQNTASRADRIRYIHGPGEQVSEARECDLVVSIGVLHHILDPRPVLRSSYAALRPGGRCLVWLYGQEGNEAYLRWVLPLRRATVRLPHFMLAGLVSLLTLAVDLYVLLCRFLPLPMRHYSRNVLARLTHDKRRLVVYDQLNPAYAKYYREDEARHLLTDAGFANVCTRHRHGYSWTVIGTRPAE